MHRLLLSAAWAAGAGRWKVWLLGAAWGSSCRALAGCPAQAWAVGGLWVIALAWHDIEAAGAGCDAGVVLAGSLVVW